MLLLKGCSRCGGDLSTNRDEYGPYVSCIQCGAMKDVPEFPQPSMALAASLVASRATVPQWDKGVAPRSSGGPTLAPVRSSVQVQN